MNAEVLSIQILRKRFSEFPMGVKPMTFQNTGWNALTTELSCWGTWKIFFRVFDLRALLHSFSLYPSHNFTYHISPHVTCIYYYRLIIHYFYQMQQPFC